MAQTEVSKKNGVASPSFAKLNDRQRFIATVAGSIAAGIVMAPSEATTSPEAIAEVAMNIAKEIVKQAANE